MRKIGLQMSFLMGLTMSFGLSVVGNVIGLITDKSDRPAPAIILGVVISFFASFLISLVIGFIVPMKKVGDIVCAINKTSSNTLKGKALSALASDIIYTPIITVAMIYLARWQAERANPGALEHMPPFIIMLLPSLIGCFIIGWVLIFIFQPLYMKIVLKKNGVKK